MDRSISLRNQAEILRYLLISDCELDGHQTEPWRVLTEIVRAIMTGSSTQLNINVINEPTQPARATNPILLSRRAYIKVDLVAV